MWLDSLKSVECRKIDFFFCLIHLFLPLCSALCDGRTFRPSLNVPLFVYQYCIHRVVDVMQLSLV
jgi:hypothetical protein